MTDHDWEIEGGRRSTERRWPHPTKGPFVLRLTFGLIDQRPEVVGVELWAVPPPKPEDPADQLLSTPSLSPIRTEHLRLPLRSLFDEWKQHRLRTAEIASAATAGPRHPEWWDDWRGDAIRTAEVVDVKRKGRADAHDDAHWHAVAEVYLAGGTKAVARTWGVSKGTAGKWVWVVRNQKGLLDPTQRGKRSGRSSPAETPNPTGRNKPKVTEKERKVAK